MKMQISEIAKITGVSVRTLHYYDEIGLLSPSQINQAGYRFYDKNALERLQQILFFKELDFPLKEIAKILSHPNYNKCEALKRQKQLLIMKKERLQHLIDLVDENLKGDNTMSFKEFDISEIKKAKEIYSDEVKKRWGDSDAYKESEERTSNYKESDWKRINHKSNEIMEDFSSLVGIDPKSKEAQNL